MLDIQRQAIKGFFDSSKLLRELDIVRSSSYVGNIAEFICADLFKVSLSKSQREEGLDGRDEEGRLVEIKYHNGKSGTNIIMSKYVDQQLFQDLIVILGPESKLRSVRLKESLFEIYRINDYQSLPRVNIAKKNLKGKLKYLLNSDLEVVEYY